MKAIPAGGLDVPLSAPNWNDSQPAGSITVSDSGELVTSVPATVEGRLRAGPSWRPATRSPRTTERPATRLPRMVATEDGGAADAGAVAAGLQAVLDTTIAAALTTNLMVLFTDRALHRATAIRRFRPL